MLGDRAQRPAAPSRSVPLVGSCGRQTQREGAGQACQPLPGLVAVGLGEVCPVGVEGQQASVPPVWLGGDAAKLCLDFGQVVDEVVGDPADRFVGGVDAVTVVAHTRSAVPVEPGRGQLEATAGGILDGDTGILGHVDQNGLTSLLSGPNGSRRTLTGMYDVDLAAVGALLGNASRAAMLDALMTGRALTVSELARVGRVSPATASEHLARLREGGLVEVVPQGRHRYHRLAGPGVGAALEALSHIAPDRAVTSLRQSARARSLAEARTCYDHLAGSCGVAIHDGLLDRRWLRPGPGGYDLTEAGYEGLTDWGVDVASAVMARGPLARACLDWTERRFHLAGTLATKMLVAFLDGPEPWFVRRADDHRGLRVTDGGRRRMAELGWQPEDQTA